LRGHAQTGNRQHTLCLTVGLVALQRFLRGDDSLTVMTLRELDLRDTRPRLFARGIGL